MALVATGLFVGGYLVLLNRTPQLATSPYPKAQILRRMAAVAIDLALIVTMLALYGQFGPWVFLSGASYIVLRDSLHGRSLGKLVCGLLVISLRTGHPATFAESIRRNVVLLVPPPIVAGGILELFTTLADSKGQRLGDRIAATQVVDGVGLKDLVPALQALWRTLGGAPPARSSRRRAIAMP
jgi:uncharacterized RDD family membrane protein YckC